MVEARKSSEWICLLRPEIAPPTLNDNTADVDRILRSLKRSLTGQVIRIDLPLAKKVSLLLRKYDYRIAAALSKTNAGWDLIDIFSSDKTIPFYGLAVDLGTSTVAMRLVDLSTHRTVDERSFLNPQIQTGADILSRIHFASGEGALERLRSLLIEEINRQIFQIGHEKGIDTDSIIAFSAAGNTAMTHFFLGLDPYWICREPYIPAVNNPPLTKAFELGIGINPGAPVFLFPNIGSYFGGDLIAGIMASGLRNSSEISFFVDVGTNAEVVIGNEDWLMGCAGAAGPALEGGVAKMGMMAGPGVIERVRIDAHSLGITVKTMNGKRPVGLCGSGLIDLAAQLFSAGMIDARGKFVKGRCGSGLIEIEGIPHIVIVPASNSGTGSDITVSQPDIDALVRSKAAMYTILTTIANQVGVRLGEIKRFFVAGTFGSFIDPVSAITIGMLPDLPVERYQPLGNTSIEGAQMALLSYDSMQEAARIRDQIAYLELNVNQEFMNLFSAARFIPHTDRSLFPSVTSASHKDPILSRISE